MTDSATSDRATSEPVVEHAPVPPLAHFINLAMIPVALITALLVLLDIDTPVRVWLAVLLFLFGAGSGITQFLRLGDRALQFGMIVALSLAIDIMVAQALLSVHNLGADASACLLAGVTCIRPSFRPHQSVDASTAAVDDSEEDA